MRLPARRKLNRVASTCGLIVCTALLAASVLGNPMPIAKSGPAPVASIAAGAVAVALALTLLYFWRWRSRRSSTRSSNDPVPGARRRDISSGIAYGVAGAGIYLLIAALFFHHLELVASALGALGFGAALVLEVVSRRSKEKPSSAG